MNKTLILNYEIEDKNLNVDDILLCHSEFIKALPSIRNCNWVHQSNMGKWLINASKA